MILEILSSTAFGSLIGTVGGWLKQKEERKNLELTLAHQHRMAIQATESKKELASVEIKQEEAKAFTESQKETSPIGAAIKSAFRPIITLVILGFAGYIIYQLDNEIGLAAFTSEEKAALYKIVVLQVFGLLGTVVGWWFASRDTKSYRHLMDKFL